MLGKKKKDKTNTATAEQTPAANQMTASATTEQPTANQQAQVAQTNQAVQNNQPAQAQPISNQAPQATPGENPENPMDAMPKVDNKTRVRKPLLPYSYTIINGVGKKERGTFDAESEEDVRNFLISQEYQVLEVKPRGKGDIEIGANTPINANDLSFSLTQLSTYIKAGIPLADSVRILAKQSTKSKLKKSFSELVYQLLKGESLSEAMLMQDKIFPKLLINMVKTAEMTGDLPSILDDMAEYYTSMDQTRKQMKSAMTYPIVVLTIAFGVLIFMLTYLVPQFTSMFESNGAELPALTKAIIATSEFIKNKWYVLVIIVLVVVIVFVQCYKRSQKFRETVQTILMHIPVAKDIIIYNEIANFTKTFSSLLNHGVFITDSMEILSKITNNEIYKRIINKTLENLGKGDSISSAFRGEWAIPVVAYEMIVTGETTGQLGAMMEKVASHFQMLHKNVIDQMKSLVEPILICFLAVVVGIILISIIQPMFSIYSQIK
ncbi:MAG: type II secretion system F family protein [Bacilli bacterium]|nr:type II secretion system F family protein [Bacilli bacterium]